MRALLRVGVVALEVLPLVSYTSSYVRYGGYRVAQRDCSASKAREVQVKSTAEPRHRLYCTLRMCMQNPFTFMLIRWHLLSTTLFGINQLPCSTLTSQHQQREWFGFANGTV